MKATAKSCSCVQCWHGKRCAAGHKILKQAERAFRHAAKIALNKGKEDIAAAPCADRIS